MFAVPCGHVQPRFGGTRMQFGAEAFTTDAKLSVCQHCNQRIPSGLSGSPVSEPVHSEQRTAITSHNPTIRSFNPNFVDPTLHEPAPVTTGTPARVSASSARASISSSTVLASTNRSSSWGDFKAASFHTSLMAAQRGGRSTQIVIGAGRPRGKGKARQPLPATEPTHDMEDEPSNSIALRYNVMLVLSHFQEPFKFEIFPETEEWIPSTIELAEQITGSAESQLQTFFPILNMMSLWHSLTSSKKDCKDYCLPFIIF